MTSKPIDLSKFRKDITKSISGISAGFHDPVDWISTGNYTLDFLISGNFNRGIPLGKVSVFAGDSGSGKSLLCSGNLARNAQKIGCQVILFDSENALDKAWLEALGVSTEPDDLLRIQVSMIDDVAKTMSDFIKAYKSSYGDLPYEEQPKLLFVIDSLGMLLTPTEVNQYQQGDMKGDMGRKAKALKALVSNTVNQIAPHPIGVVATNHTYASQNMFDPDEVISGGSGFIYASSIVVAMKKLKLKEDEEGNKISQVRGIRSACKIMKTRYSKPFESVQVKIPYDGGMDMYSGLLDFFEARGVVEKTGNKLIYVSPEDGAEIKLFRKQWDRNEGGCLDRVMNEIAHFINHDEPAREEIEDLENDA
jgi:recombination protein RecA